MLYLTTGSLSDSSAVHPQVHLKEPVELFKFLCLLWGYCANRGDQLDVRVNAILQTKALYVGRALLSAQPAGTLEALASTKSPGKTEVRMDTMPQQGAG